MSDDQFTKLSNQLTALDSKIAAVENRLDHKIDSRVAAVDSKISKLTDLVMKLYAHTEKRFSEIEAKLDDKADKKQVDLILGTLDTVLKNQETLEQEQLIMGHQLSRHEQWFDQLATKTKTKLMPDR